MAEQHIGIDEAGRGCLAGPVVAAAVLFPEGFDISSRLPGLTDSKKLSIAKRETLAARTVELAVAHGLGIVWQEEIDAVNILNATFRAMARAALSLAADLPDACGRDGTLPAMLIDGNRIIPPFHWGNCAEFFEGGGSDWGRLLDLPERPLPGRIPPLPEQYAVVGGDALVPSVSAASVLAKTARDKIMKTMDALYPGYGLARHKGYGTKEHLAVLVEKGPSPAHRKTFRGVLSQTRQLTLFS